MTMPAGQIFQGDGALRDSWVYTTTSAKFKHHFVTGVGSIVASFSFPEARFYCRPAQKSPLERAWLMTGRAMWQSAREVDRIYGVKRVQHPEQLRSYWTSAGLYFNNEPTDNLGGGI
jgi:hypothetical protein